MMVKKKISRRSKKNAIDEDKTKDLIGGGSGVFDEPEAISVSGSLITYGVPFACIPENGGYRITLKANKEVDSIGFTQLNIFANALICLIDSGESESLEVIENHQDDIVNYMMNQYGEKYRVLSNDNKNFDEKVVQNFIDEQYISEKEMKKEGVKNNGLLFLVILILNKIVDESVAYEDIED